MARYENSHAYVNMGACVSVSSAGVIQASPQPVIVFGGAYGTTTRVPSVEQAMVGMQVTDQVLICAYVMYAGMLCV